jgi:hypothetical protein
MGQFHGDTLATHSSEASRRPGSTSLRFRSIILRIGEPTKTPETRHAHIHRLVPSRLVYN